MLHRALIVCLLAVAPGCVTAPHVFRVTPGPFTGPRVLVVVAHPDDEIAFAGLLYKTATHLNGACDVVTITNGEGGYKYSTLAEPIYGLRLTDEAVGRAALPEIRRGELRAGCRILNVRRLYVLGEKDHRYTQDADEILGDGADVWDVASVLDRLSEVLADEDYDFVLTLAPVAQTHGHHKAASILALRAVTAMPREDRPVVLCVRGSSKDRPIETPFVLLDGYEITRVRTDVAPFVFDRAQKFGYLDRLDYSIVANWAIAEHKSQGTMQTSMGPAGQENYYLYAINDDGGGAVARARELFDRLAEPQFAAPVYDASSP